jgi:Zn-dependent protease/CBS domain-containing protein
MGRLFGVPVYVAPTWVVVAFLITLMFAPHVEAEVPGLGPGRFLVSFLYAVLLYASVLVHELGHAVVATRLGMPVRRITLHLLGGVTEMSGQAKTPGREFLVAVAGPVLSIALGGLAFAAGQVVNGGGTATRIASLLLFALMLANLVVGVFNLFPGLPLDGGVLLRAAVWKVTGRAYTGTLVAAWVGRGVAVLLLAFPLLLEAFTNFIPDVVTYIWFALIAAFIWMGAGSALQMARLRERLPSVAAGTLTRRAIPVTGDVPLAEALRRAGEAGARALVVVDSTGAPVGLVSEAAVTATPEQRRPWIDVGSVSRTLEPGLVLHRSLAGEDLVRAMQASPASEYLVLDREGAIYGVLAAADVERAVVAG